MIYVLINCSKSKEKEAIYTFETLLSMMGLPYKIYTIDFNKNISKDECSMVIYYGPMNLSQKLNNYLENGGCVINIPCYIEILNNKRKIRNTPGNKINSCFPPKVSSYLYGNIINKTPFFYPYISFDTKLGEPLYFYDSLGNDRISSYLRKYSKGILIRVGMDLISSAFYMLMCQEEISSKKRDEFNRFTAKFSIAYKEKFYQRPIVNEYIDLINNLINICYQKTEQPIIQICHWPEDKDFAVCLTHDIDGIQLFNPHWISHTPQRAIKNLLEGKIEQAIREIKIAISALVKGKIFQLREDDPLWNFDYIMQLESDHGFKSSFFFGRGNEEIKYVEGIDVALRYDIERKSIRDLIQKIVAKGWEIGLHSSYDSYKNFDKLQEEKKKLESVSHHKILGCRQHFLRFDPGLTWEIQYNNGFTYDTSLGFPNECGFRAGYCFPYYPYNIQKNIRYNILEIPLIFMDSTLIERSFKLAKETLKKLINSTEQHRGVFMLLWHNTMFLYELYPEWRSLYKDILSYLYNTKAYVTTCKDLADWWDKRNNLKFENVKYDKNNMKWTLKANKEIKNLCLNLRLPKSYRQYSTDLTVSDIENYEITKEQDVIHLMMSLVPSGKKISITLRIS